jgi:hypothetical protein
MMAQHTTSSSVIERVVTTASNGNKKPWGHHEDKDDSEWWIAFLFLEKIVVLYLYPLSKIKRLPLSRKEPILFIYTMDMLDLWHWLKSRFPHVCPSYASF